MKNCLQCNGAKFSDRLQHIPGTFTSDCQSCYLTNIHDEYDTMFGYVKKFQYLDKHYTFYAFRLKDICILAEDADGIIYNMDMKNNYIIIDRFPKYVHAYDVNQETLKEIVKYKQEEKETTALPDINLMGV